MALHAIGGQLSGPARIAILMHEGLDAVPSSAVKGYIDFARRKLPNDGSFWLIEGYHDDPLRAWPVYAVKAPPDNPIWSLIRVAQGKKKAGL